MTPEEIHRLARDLVSHTVAPDEVRWSDMLPIERAAVLILSRTLADQKRLRQRKAQRRAMSLLRTFLTPTQRAELRRTRHFTLATATKRYRFHPTSGTLARIELRGKTWFAVERLCFHDPEQEMPPADATLGQMLHLLADERAFLASVNARDALDMLWNRDYLRTLREARRAREAA